MPLDLSEVAQVTAGMDHTCAAMKKDGTVRCWGRNFDGEVTVPPGLSGVVKLAAAHRRTCAITGDGGMTCFGALELL